MCRCIVCHEETNNICVCVGCMEAICGRKACKNIHNRYHKRKEKKR